MVCSIECSQILKRMTEVRDVQCRKRREQPRMARARVLSGLAARSSRPRGRCRGSARARTMVRACVMRERRVESPYERPLARNAALAVRPLRTANGDERFDAHPHTKRGSNSRHQDNRSSPSIRRRWWRPTPCTAGLPADLHRRSGVAITHH
jgi:hypothetical protein